MIINLDSLRVTKPSLAKLGKLCTPNFSAGEADEKEASKVAQKSGTGLVTRTASATGDTFSTNNVQNDSLAGCTASPTGWTFCTNNIQNPHQVYPFFIDWVSISQTHQQDLSVFCSGKVVCYDENGEIDWVTYKKLSQEGSYRSSVLIRCDGSTVTFEGNPGRFNRRDNVFGYDLDTCIHLINEILAKHGLPPFIKGVSYLMQSVDLPQWTGARISKLDLTCNYATGSEQNAFDFMRWAATQQDSRIKTGVYDDGQTVDYGRGSKRIYHKIYNKHFQLVKHKRKESGQYIDDEVLEWVKLNGIVRHEVSVKSRTLTDLGIAFLGVCNMAHLYEIYQQRAEIIKRQTAETDGFDDLPKHLRLTVRDYLAGMNLSLTMSKRTFYRHRSDLLPYGIDIAIPSKVTQFQPKVKVIIAQPVSAPDWYWQRSA